MRKILLFTFVLASCSSLYAQSGYKIDFKISGLADTTVYLGNFFGESTYVKDTATVDENGIFSFTGEEKLQEGVYFLVLNKSRLFDILISQDQHFKLEAAYPDYVESMRVTGDIENEQFFKDLAFNKARNAEAKPHVAIIKDSTSSISAVKSARENLERINRRVIEHQDEIINRQPHSLLARIFKANKRIKIPEAPRSADGKIDSTFSYRYYKANYWDNFDLSDPALLRLSEPIYRKKVENYLDKLFLQHPDTLIQAINQLIQKAKNNSDTYKYLVWSLTIKYQNHEIMGLDAVFVDLFDRYFASGEMDFWANPQLKQNLKERADQLRSSLIGMSAPNLIMLDEDLKPRSLHDLRNKYSIIYFYDPDCGHCKKETPRLKKYFEETSFDIGVFAVSADTSMVKMRSYIKAMGIQDWVTVNGPRTYTEQYQTLYDAYTTPTIYVLDEQKKIIAKKIPADKLEGFLNHYEGIQRDNTSGGDNTGR